jgi:hypothetical protein
MPLLPAGSRLHVVSGADHSFLDRYDELLAVAVPWLAGQVDQSTSNQSRVSSSQRTVPPHRPYAE